MTTRPIDLELQRGGSILKSVIRISTKADLTAISTAARQIAFRTGSSKVRVCVGNQWSSWLSPAITRPEEPNAIL